MEISLASVTIDRWEILGAVASTVNAIASLVAISFVAIQLKSSNQIAQAQLINELERDISLDTNIYFSIGHNLKDDDVELSESDRIGILKCLSFFERVHLILDTKVVDISVVDRIFAGRFFLLFNNPKVQELMANEEMKPYMQSIHDLHSKWCFYREQKGFTTPLMDLEALRVGRIIQ
jgi:hypothetical protein